MNSFESEEDFSFPLPGHGFHGKGLVHQFQLLSDSHSLLFDLVEEPLKFSEALVELLLGFKLIVIDF